PKELEEEITIKKAIEKLDIMSLNKEEREIYENDLKRLRIYSADIKTAEKKGIEKGIEKGKIEIVKNMLQIGMEIEKIKILTELSEEKILEIMNK
ncbi:MAG: transposase, partial [Anaeromicrobium sp.]|nr:transposase [Anaeromicrobium sp.]